MNKTKYSDVLVEWLHELGYTHCLYVAGGNIMHLLESASRRFKCVSVIHEVAAGVAAEYFNETGDGRKAFALVTAGPGLTNIVTAMAGAYLESRELLVIGGQVKTADLSHGVLRQRGIQEIAGVDIARPVTVSSVLMEDVVDKQTFASMASAGSSGRKGPVFLEIPLDIQGRQVDPQALVRRVPAVAGGTMPFVEPGVIDNIAERIRKAERPMFLLGGGVDRQTAWGLSDNFKRLGVPVTTTWNGADRITNDHPMYFGRPNTWGQRYSNILLQQTDLLIALGTRLGMQQTGFNWQEFVPVGRVIQVDCDPAELAKGHPRVDLPIQADANSILTGLATRDLGQHKEWVAFCQSVKQKLPLIEDCNTTGEGYLSPYRFVERLSEVAANTDIVIPCSSGGAFTVMMQTFAIKPGQKMVTNKGLASMGYGLSGAIGAALANPEKRVLLAEGDGGFAQNLQELGTAAINSLNLKIFIFNDNGYASIRMTQRNYFGGRYVGCDRASGLGLPDWETLFKAYNIPSLRLTPGFQEDARFNELFTQRGPAAFIVMIDPEQTYFPKITSHVTVSGSMASNPLHRMTPDLPAEVENDVLKYIARKGLILGSE